VGARWWQSRAAQQRVETVAVEALADASGRMGRSGGGGGGGAAVLEQKRQRQVYSANAAKKLPVGKIVNRYYLILTRKITYPST
jgi:hypothetical protein